jgi:hypothetical protein
MNSDKDRWRDNVVTLAANLKTAIEGFNSEEIGRQNSIMAYGRRTAETERLKDLAQAPFDKLVEAHELLCQLARNEGFASLIEDLEF